MRRYFLPFDSAPYIGGVEKSYEYRIYPSQEQALLLARTFGCSRWVFNHFLEEKIRFFKETRQLLSYCKCSKMLTKIKTQEDTAWLAEVEAAALQQSLRNLDRAFDNFSKRRKQGVGFPKFKKKKSRKTYHTPAAKIADDSHVWIPKVGLVKTRISRPIQGRITSATIKRKDHLHKVTAKIVSENQVVCAETLDVSGMLKNRYIAKRIANQSFATILGFLEYKAKAKGKTFVQVGGDFASSKICHACGAREEKMPASKRRWKCKSCGTKHDRDINAAKNILAEGMRVLEGTEGHSGAAAITVAA